MPPSRRLFLKRTLAAAALSSMGGAGCSAAAQPAGKSILLNHLGFPRGGTKCFLAPTGSGDRFELLDAGSGRVVKDGPLHRASGDLGDYVVGELISWTTTGTYRVRVGTHSSHPFAISDTIYDDAVRKAIAYFAIQRCGDSTTGYHSPCHLDDGVRQDEGRRVDVTGGWHDACDVRKWVNATIYGMIGLARLLDSPAAARLNARDRILDELRWGNRYFLAMQHPDGYVMNYCGGDDGNDWTDNQPGTADDRRIHTDPADVPAQYNFITAQALVARHVRGIDPDYAQRCEAAGDRCLAWVTNNRRPGAARSLGACTLAMLALHRLRSDDDARTRAAAALRLLQSLQITDGDPRGFFRADGDSREPMREIMHGNLPLIAISEALLTWPGHPDATRWRDTLTLHSDHLAALAARSAFGIIPFGLYGDRAASPRRIGSCAYRYFMRPGRDSDDSDWWVGINAHLASHGVGLLRASRALARPHLASLAQRQLDWILGCNPLDASTLTGYGRNHPRLYTPGHLKPPTPLLAGGVMNGIGGDAGDEPDLRPGSWHTCEYWTPMVAWTMWLLAELP